MNDRERRIRDLAYRIWEESGRPDGQDDRHWSDAERRYAEDLGAGPPSEKTAAKPRAKRAGAAADAPPKPAGRGE